MCSKVTEENVEQYEQFFDEVAGTQLLAELVAQGKKEEIDWVRSIKLYDKVPRRMAKERGKQIVRTRWVIVNKGDEKKYNVRCRLVGQELKAKTKEALLAYELFSATPPWEVVKCLFSMLVTDDVFEAPSLAQEGASGPKTGAELGVLGHGNRTERNPKNPGHGNRTGQDTESYGVLPSCQNGMGGPGTRGLVP